MLQIVRPSSVQRHRLGLGLAASVLAGAIMILAGGAASAAATVSKLVFSPSPIGTESTVTPGSSVAITLTAEDSNGVAIPGATVYLSFAQNTGGGTAVVGTTALKKKPKAFVADAAGHVAIKYTAPTSFPSSGCDDLKAQNAATRATSTAFNADALCFSPITGFVFNPTPVAKKASLHASTQVTVTLTVLGAGGAPLANGSVWLSFKAASATSGAKATVNGVALTTTPSAATTNASGQVTIIYSTGTVLPTTGFDRIHAWNAPEFGTVTSGDAYLY